MRLLKRNLKEFEYRAYIGKTEVISDGKHTGRLQAQYGDPVLYRGNISAARNSAYHEFFGIGTNYTHVLLVEGADTGFTEEGLIDWNGNVYEIVRVSPSLNVTALALKKRVTNNAVSG